MKNKKNIFSLLLIALLFISLFILLGCWQITRAKEKQRLINLAQYNTEQVISPEQLKIQNKALNAIPVIIEGIYDEKHTVFLSNQFYHHQFGKEVLTPLKLINNTIILVNRGWVPENQIILKNEIPNKKIQLHGHLKLPKKNPFIHSSLDKINKNNELYLMEYDAELLSELWKQPVLPYVLLLNPKEPYGYTREWVISVIPPSRHWGYAIQWFALALALTIISLILFFKALQGKQ